MRDRVRAFSSVVCGRSLALLSSTLNKTRALTRGWTILAAFLLVTTSVEARTINFAWDPSVDPNLAGYYLLTGTQPGVYTQQITVGKLTTTGNVNVPDGQSFYVAVEAYNSAG